MRPSALVATATIVVLAFGASACKSSSKSGAPAAASNPPATETQADSDNPLVSAAPSASPSASASLAASASPVASVAASASASTPASAPPSAAASTAPAAARRRAERVLVDDRGRGASLTGRKYGAGTARRSPPGRSSATYPYSGPSVDLDVIVYAPSSGVSWNTMQSVLTGVGTVMPVSGVGDKAMFAGVELDVATGKWLVAIQGADDLGKDAGAIAIGKQLVGALASK